MLVAVVMGVSRGVMKGAISEGKRCAIIGLIAQRSGVRKRPFSPLFLARIHRTGWWRRNGG